VVGPLLGQQESYYFSLPFVGGGGRDEVVRLRWWQSV